METVLPAVLLMPSTEFFFATGDGDTRERGYSGLNQAQPFGRGFVFFFGEPLDVKMQNGGFFFDLK